MTVLNTQPNPRLRRVRNLLAGPHGPGSPIFQELAKHTKDMTYFYEDFVAATAAEAVGSSKVWQYAESTGAPVDVAKVTPTFALGSYVQLDTNTTDAANMELLGPKLFVAKANPFFECRFQIDTALANDTYELTMGFVDAVPASAGDIGGDIDTPTFGGGIADAAVFHMDGDETLKTAAAMTIGTSTAVGKTTLPTAAPFGLPTLNVDVTYRVELRSAPANSSVSQAYFFINDALVAQRVGPDAEKLLTPVFLLGVRSTTRVIAKIDYLEIGQEKSGAPF